MKLRHDNVCVDNKGQGVNGGPIGVYSCHHLGGSQVSSGQEIYRGNIKLWRWKEIVKKWVKDTSMDC